MKHKINLNQRWILITGASSELGKAIAWQLASEHRANLILVARREHKLIELQHQLQNQFGIHCTSIKADLARPEEVDAMIQQATEQHDLFAAILNAGVTYFGEHQDLSWHQFENLLATNVTSIMRCVHSLIPYLKNKPQGGAILLVSSIGGLIPVPYQAAYSGTKAFITQFGLSLAEELKQHNINISVFAPGGIATEMNHKSGLSAQFEGSALLQPPEVCAAQAIETLQQGRTFSVPGFTNKLQIFATRLIPRAALLQIAGHLYRKALAKKHNT